MQNVYMPRRPPRRPAGTPPVAQPVRHAGNVRPLTTTHTPKTRVQILPRHVAELHADPAERLGDVPIASPSSSPPIATSAQPTIFSTNGRRPASSPARTRPRRTPAPVSFRAPFTFPVALAVALAGPARCLPAVRSRRGRGPSSPPADSLPRPSVRRPSAAGRPSQRNPHVPPRAPRTARTSRTSRTRTPRRHAPAGRDPASPSAVDGSSAPPPRAARPPPTTADAPRPPPPARTPPSSSPARCTAAPAARPAPQPPCRCSPT